MPVALTLAAMFTTASPALADGPRASRLVLDMATLGVAGVQSVSRDEAPASEPAYRVPATHSAKPPRSRYSITIPLDPPQAGPPRPRIFGRADRPLVVIDAGHGGHDPGAISPQTATREKDVTLGVARAIRDELLKGGRVRVALTRDDDRFLILQERAEIARGLKADLFISVHADAAVATEASGATIYTLSEVASDRKAAQLAARENKSDIINGVNLRGEGADVSSILIDLAQRETMNASARFADLLKREGSAMPFRGDYHRMAGFAVLKAPDTPAILLEVGYLTNVADVERITSVEGRAAIATGIRRAVDVHFARRFASR
jgi:N-acetylmuramoyl-L-alanine amidase